MKRRKFIESMVAGCASVTGLGAVPGAVRAAVSSDSNYLYKMENFDADYVSDMFLTPSDLPLLKAVVGRLKGVQRTVGYGNFYMLGFDDMVKIAGSYSAVGSFTAAELAFIEQIYAIDARDYGFFGDKVLSNLTDEVPAKETTKISHGAQRVFKGAPLAKYQVMRKIIGDDLILTSGVRSMAKQCYLGSTRICVG